MCISTIGTRGDVQPYGAFQPIEPSLVRRRRAAGATLRQIADEMHCSVESVRKGWHYLRSARSPGARGRPQIWIGIGFDRS